MNIDVIIPALDEEATIGAVVGALPRPPLRHIIVVDNGSRDRTADEARRAGARVVVEAERGYGAACLAGLAALPVDTEVVLFLDGDGSDDPAAIVALLGPILEGRADLVVGARDARRGEVGALSLQQRLGNHLAAFWLRRRFGVNATDLGPFRAIRKASLVALGMTDHDYGWTIEMQVKAARLGLRYAEVAVAPRRRRGGRSKVSGTLRGTLGAAVKILGLLGYYDLIAPRAAAVRGARAGFVARSRRKRSRSSGRSTS